MAGIGGSNRRFRAQRKVDGLRSSGWRVDLAAAWPGLEVLIPWHFVISLVTAQEPQSSKTFGLIIEAAERSALEKTP